MSELVNTLKAMPEEEMLKAGIRVSDEEIEEVGQAYFDLYKWRGYRNGITKHFQNKRFEDYLTLSRELFWNSLATNSDDLNNLGLNLSIPFSRKEVMDMLAKLTSLGIKPQIAGDTLDSLGIRILQGIYKKWRFKANDKVESFWENLYGIVNGTVDSYIGWTSTNMTRRYLKEYDPANNHYRIDEKKEKYWNDATSQIVPLEDLYLPKIYERDIQKQGKLIWRTQMDEDDFHSEFGNFPLHKFVHPGMRIAENSLYYRLLGGPGAASAHKVEVMRRYNWIKDEYQIIAGGIILNKVSAKIWSPMPFDHKMAPHAWGIYNPIDNNLPYGLSVSFLGKDPHKILNVSYSMMVERELRAIDPPIISSDIESPEFIFGSHKIQQVNDINAYKEFQIGEPSMQYFNMMNALQGNMTSTAQGGNTVAAPSRQPDAARKVAEDAKLKEQASSNLVLMYYNMQRQKIMLLIKTMLQFYSNDKYSRADKNVMRTIMASDMPLSMGGIGNMKINITKETRDPMELFKEGIKESIMNGKATEIVDVPIEFIQDLDFIINRIDLEPEDSTKLEMANFTENVLGPMMKMYIPLGLADPAKVMLRHLEKMGEPMSDYTSENAMAAIIGKSVKTTSQELPDGQTNVGQTTGNLLQMDTGMNNGANQSGPMTTRFGAPNATPLPK